MEGERGQSEVLGVTLLVGVTVIVVSTFAAFFLGGPLFEEGGPTADVEVTVTNGSVEAFHDGGDSLETAGIGVSLRVAGRPTNATWAAGSLTGGTPETFDPGERWTLAEASVNESWAAGDEVRVYLTADGGRVVLYGGRVTARADAGTVANLGPVGTGPTGPNAPPTLSIDDVSPGYVSDGQTVTVTYSVSDDDPVTTTLDATDLGAGTDTVAGNKSGATWTFTVNDGGDGTEQVVLSADDDAGGTVTDSATVTLDNTPPTVSNFRVSEVAGDVEVTIEADERLDAITVDTSWGSGTLAEGDFSESGGTYTATYDPSGDGSFSATLTEARDRAGNDYGGSLSDSTTIDTTKPTATGASITGGPTIEDGETGVTRYVTVQFSESMDRTVTPTVTIENLTSSPLAVTEVRWEDAATWNGSVTVPDDDETRTAEVRIADAEDTDGNRMSPTVAGTFRVETDAPQRVKDPGQAFEDQDGDGYYEAGDGDVLVDLPANSYQYDAASNGASLVVPSSVSTLNPDGPVSLTGENVTLRTGVDASGAITVEATTDDANVSGVALGNTAGGDADVSVSAGGTVDVANTDIKTDGTVAVAGTDGVTGQGVSIDGTFSGASPVTVDSSNGPVTVDGASLAGDDSITVTAGATLSASGTSVDTPGTVTMTAPDAVSASGLTIDNQDGGSADVVVESTGSRVDVSGATVNADGTLTVKGQTTATLDDATIDHNQNSGGLSVDVDAVSDDASLQGARVTSLVPVTIDAGGDVLAADATVDTSGAYDKSVTVTAAGKVDTTGGTITTQGPVTLTASGGDVIAPGTSVDTSGAYGMEIRIESTADVDVSSSTLRTNSGRILADLAKRSTVSVGGATFSGYDRNGRGNNANGVDELVVTPKQVTQNGTPGSGEVVFTNNP